MSRARWIVLALVFMLGAMATTYLLSPGIYLRFRIPENFNRRIKHMKLLIWNPSDRKDISRSTRCEAWFDSQQSGKHAALVRRNIILTTGQLPLTLDGSSAGIIATCLLASVQGVTMKRRFVLGVVTAAVLVITNVAAVGAYASEPVTNPLKSRVPEQALASCPPTTDLARLDPSQAEVRDGATVRFGSDVLGRVAFAIDYNGDNFADEVMLYWEKSRRFDIPVRTVRSVKLVVFDGVLMLQAADRSVAAIFGVDGRDTQLLDKSELRKARRTIIAEKGNGFARVGIDPASGRHLDGFDHTSLYTWPEGFREDLQFQQQTNGGGWCPNCPNSANYACQAGGGCYAQSCNIPCTGACSVSCAPNSFACCNCPGGSTSGPCLATCYGCEGIPP